MKKNLWISELKKNLPSNKNKWKAYLLTAIPVIFSSLIFALNSFIDNFMSINIQGGNQALAYANGWTEIQLGIISATTIIGTSLFSQYVGKQDWSKVKEVINLRMIFALGICMIFVIPCLIFPNFMTNVISAFDDISNEIREKANNYLRIITISWILNAWGFTMIMILRERNHVFVSLFSSILTVFINIFLNSIFIFVLNKGIEYLAYSTIISLSIDIIFMMSWIWIKDKKIFLNIFKIFKISRHIAKQFFKKIWSFLLFAIGSILVNVRFIQWNAGYGTGKIGLSYLRISSATILGITGMFFNIFWTTFESLSATVAVYVGRELGKNNISEAKKNAKELQGFHLILAITICLLAITLSFCSKYMSFLTEGYVKEIKHYYEVNPLPENINIEQIINEGKNTMLNNIKNSLLGISVYIPLFVWFVSRSRIISVGGLTNVVSFIEVIIGLFQTAWLAFICFGLSKLNVQFAWSYFIFYLSDIPKLIVYEVLYFKINWAKNITNEKIIE